MCKYGVVIVEIWWEQDGIVDWCRFSVVREYGVPSELADKQENDFINQWKEEHKGVDKYEIKHSCKEYDY